MENKRNDLGYLGIEFQYRLVHHFMDDKKFFGDMYDIIDNNMFTEPNLKKFVRGICEYYYKYSCVPSYEQLEIKLRSESNSMFISSMSTGFGGGTVTLSMRCISQNGLSRLSLQDDIAKSDLF